MQTLCLVEVTQLRIEVVELCKRDTKTTNTLSPHTEVHCSISTNLCMMVDEVRAIISPPNGFWVRSIV